MVSYFNAGTQWATARATRRRSTRQRRAGSTSPCRRAPCSRRRTCRRRRRQCKAAGKPIKMLVYTGQDQATAAVATGKADAMLADSPVVAYAVKQSDGQARGGSATSTTRPRTATWSPKDQTDFAQAIVDGAEGARQPTAATRRSSTSWGVEAGAISDFAVNPP